MTTTGGGPLELEYAGRQVRAGRGTPVGSAVLWVASTIAWAVAAVILLGLISVALTYGLGIPYGWFVIPLVLVVLLLVTARTVRLVRRRRAETVLAYVEQAVRLNLPLPAMLAAAERGEPPGVARQLANLRQLLSQGTTLAAAIEASVPQVTARTVALTAAGERTGRVAAALHRLVHRDRRAKWDAAAGDAVTGAFSRIYPLVLALMTGGLIGVLMVFVLPKFGDIFRDFGIEQPPLTRWTFEVAWVAGPPIMAVLPLILLVMVARAVAETFVPPRYRLELGKGPIDRALWALPLTHGAARDRGLADAFDVLADAADAGMPLDAALDEAARLRLNEVLRHRLRAWRDAVADGTAADEAARRARLPPIVAGMISAGGGRGNLGDVFRFLARYYGARFSRLTLLLQGAVTPAVVIVFAVITGLVALAMFLPLVQLIDQVSLTTELM